MYKYEQIYEHMKEQKKKDNNEEFPSEPDLSHEYYTPKTEELIYDGVNCGYGKLYLTGYDHISSEELIYNPNIFKIAVSNKLRYSGSMQNYIHIPISDNETEPIEKYFDKTSDLIHTHLSSGKDVLVFCAQGISRSPSIVIAYLMKYGLIIDGTKKKFNTFYNAIEFIESRRDILPNEGFYHKLLEYGNELFYRKWLYSFCNFVLSPASLK